MTLRGRRGALAAAAAILLLSACAGDPRPTPMTANGSAMSSAPSADPVTTSAQPTDEPAILALGDSMTYGVGVPDPDAHAFPALLADALGAERRVIAVPGETAAGFRERHLSRAEDAIARLGRRLEMVTIGLGANELLRVRRLPACVDDRASAACRRLATEATEEAAIALDAVTSRVADAVTRAGSHAPIALLAYYNPDLEPVAATTMVGTDGAVACDPAESAPGLDDRIACVAERHGAVLVDLHTAFAGREDELTGIPRGDVHPTREGHRVIADAVRDAVDAAR